MDSTKEDKHNFTRIASISSEAEIVEPDSLSMETIQQVLAAFNFLIHST